MTHKINIIIKNKRDKCYYRFIRKTAINLLDILIKELNLKCKNFEMTIMLVNTKVIANLNQAHRNKNKPTNVLSFPFEDLDYKTVSETVFYNNYYLGDVAICETVLRKEAKEQSISFANHLAHMILHSILHLFSFDHENDDDEKIMFSIEEKIMKQQNIQ
jgi:probable rRNA maturation factor